MKTEVVKPQDVFYNPTRLMVPLFQRPYVWSQQEQWEPLWEDIARLIDVIEGHNQDATHFLGAIVIQQVPSRLGALPTWNIIDGQQRLTTLQLLLDALHAQLERRGLGDYADQILPLVENPKSFRKAEEDRFKLWPTNRDRASFGAVMSAPSPISYSTLPASRLRDAHHYFSEAIDMWLGQDDAEQKASLLVGAVTGRLEIASIRLDSNEDAQAIFETLNARGTPLSAADLIKNFIFQQVDAAGAERDYLAYWADFETPWWETEVTSGRIKNPRASLFLWQWLTARTLTDFPIREVFTQFKHYVNTVEKDVAALLPQIKMAADRYRAIIEGSENPNGPLDRAQLFSYRVGTLDSEISRPLLIWLDEPEQADVSDADRSRILELLESWFVRRALVKAPSQGSNRFLVDMLRLISRRPKNQLADAVEHFLVSNHTAVGYWPGDDEVRVALSDANIYGQYRRSRVRMVLEALEDAKRGFPGANPLAMGPIVRNKATIEHLMPQKWRAHWAAELSEDEERDRDRRVQQLGNLTIVTQALNSRVSNGAWEQKRAHFLASDDVLITKQALALAADRAWDERAIAARTKQMIEQILTVWPAPPGHVGMEVPPPPPVTRASVDIAQLVDAGWLTTGTELVPRQQARAGMTAVVSKDGRLHIGDTAYDTPSAAAGVAYSGKGAVNGWWFWGIAGTDRRLTDVRADYLASLGDDEENPDIDEIVGDADERP
ncbi:GmrSD restriction endonuclease domain-containing protein [Microbacterium aureliae]